MNSKEKIGCIRTMKRDIRFLGSVDNWGGEGCWLWTKTLNTQGYGRFNVGGKHVSAHRLSLVMNGRPLIDGLVVDHICRVRRCINPEHLRQVTSRENILEPRSEGPTTKNHYMSACLMGHALTGKNLIVKKYKNGTSQRRCRQCYNDYMKSKRHFRKIPALLDASKIKEI